MNVPGTADDIVTALSTSGAQWPLRRYACALCGSWEHRPVRKKRGRIIQYEFSIVACRRCGFVFVNPRISDEAIDGLYDQAYYKGEGFDASVRYDEAESNESTCRQIEQVVATVAEAVGKASRLDGIACLDVGCGSGALVSALAARGAIALGQDSSKEAVRLAGRRGVEVRSQSVDCIVQSEARFDVVTAIEVIEHVPHPAAFARSLAALLRPGGLLLLGTGNWNVVRWIPGTPYLMPEGHLQYFTPATMSRLFDLAGLCHRSRALNGTWTACRIVSRLGLGLARSPLVRALSAVTRVLTPGLAPMPLALKAPKVPP